jgi:hypothetical protein
VKRYGWRTGARDNVFKRGRGKREGNERTSLRRQGMKGMKTWRRRNTTMKGVEIDGRKIWRKVYRKMRGNVGIKIVRKQC